jgi:hypothetical protein
MPQEDLGAVPWTPKSGEGRALATSDSHAGRYRTIAVLNSPKGVDFRGRWAVIQASVEEAT